ncbi:GNAT family N-acetyltransferase [Pseudomonas putida]|uniref:GNAT family N-acetyltransferase n=1 Tax=Pseudomonas putida TaxID=303 RepID=A0A2Z4RH82_PSEPU|nr:GNAT family N-acetyltransferase [Pseudomonas putida]AWY40403.1 GNAT family N-acetyltransferase [Pseudomonas putida]
MDNPIQTCKATPADVGIISRIIERSIRVGCARDHRNQPQTLAAWTCNTTDEHIRHWLTDPRLYLNIALLQNKPVGVAMASVCGKVAFCYVQPESFRRGAGRTLVRDLEDWLINQGQQRVRLHCTRSSEPFYRHLGYQPGSVAFMVAGLEVVPLQKGLASPSSKAHPGSKSSRGESQPQ